MTKTAMSVCLLAAALLLGACHGKHTAPISTIEREDPNPVTANQAPATVSEKILGAIQAHEDALGCRVGFSLMMPSENVHIARHGDVLFHPASTMKVPVMIETFRQAAEGNFAMDDKVEVVTTFESFIDGSEFTAGPSSRLRDHVGKNVTILKLVEDMMEVSDNVATNMLVIMCGPRKITATMRGLGAEKSYVIRPLMDEQAYQAGLSNRMTPDGLSILKQRIVEGDAGTDAHTKEMMRIMEAQEYRDKIPAGVPEGVTVGNKTGSITAHRHDTGYVLAPFGNYYITILIDGLKDGDAGNAAAADISRVVYETLDEEFGG